MEQLAAKVRQTVPGGLVDACVLAEKAEDACVLGNSEPLNNAVTQVVNLLRRDCPAKIAHSMLGAS